MIFITNIVLYITLVNAALIHIASVLFPPCIVYAGHSRENMHLFHFFLLRKTQILESQFSACVLQTLKQSRHRSCPKYLSLHSIAFINAANLFLLFI